MSGKGSAPRPFSVGHDIFAKQFEATFGKKNDKNSPSTECPVAESGDSTGKEDSSNDLQKNSP